MNQQTFRRAAAVLTVLLLGACAANVQNAGDPADGLYRINIRGIPSADLLVLLGTLGDLNVVASDEFRDVPLDVTEASVGPKELVKRMAAGQGLAVGQYKNILVVASSCRLEQQAGGIPDHKEYRERIGLNFVRVSAGDLFRIFGDFLDEPVETPGDRREGLTSVRSKPLERGEMARDFMGALATALGWTAVPGQKKGVKFVANPKLATCATPAGTGPAAVRARVAERKDCAREPVNRCMPLEYYELEDLRFVGWILDLATSSPFVVVSLGTHAVAAKVGDLLGQKGAKIISISENSVTIEEPATDTSGGKIMRRRSFAVQ